MVTIIDFFDQSTQAIGAITIGCGLLVVLHGLRGRASTRRGLLRSNAGTLQRTLGWRRFLIGLLLVGLGAALIFDSTLLLVLSLGIGFVELYEASFVISVMQHDDKHHHDQPAPQR